MAKTQTQILREEILEYLKQQGPEFKIRESELTKYLVANSAVSSPSTVLPGIYQKIEGKHGVRISIPGVKRYKEGSKVYYTYSPEYFKFEEGTTMYSIKESLNRFEDDLRKNNLWNVAVLELPFEERKAYLQFLEKFEEMRTLFDSEK